MNRLTRKAENIDLLKLLKDDLQGEYDAIKMYDEHIENIDIPEVKELLIHIRDEEKEHVKELMKLIKKYE